MDKSRKRIRLCLICVVSVAVILGVTYYLFGEENREVMTDGTLISRMSHMGERFVELWR